MACRNIFLSLSLQHGCKLQCYVTSSQGTHTLLTWLWWFYVWLNNILCFMSCSCLHRMGIEVVAGAFRSRLLWAITWKQRSLPLQCTEIFCVEFCSEVVHCSHSSYLLGSASASLFSSYRSNLKLHCTACSIILSPVSSSTGNVICHVWLRLYVSSWHAVAALWTVWSVIHICLLSREGAK